MVFQYSSGVGRVVVSYVALKERASHVGLEDVAMGQNPDSSTHLERVRRHAIQLFEVTIATSDGEGLGHGGGGQVWLCR